jgi:flavin reductase (DIM6/NTAB) family NADH-FMN oxidoreductase RutF
MTQDARNLPGEQLREAMRRWVTGVSIVSSKHGEHSHGMTVNSFVSISIDPALIAVTLAKNTRTHALVKGSGFLGVSILSQEQGTLADIFAGRIPDGGDRFHGVQTFSLLGQVPLISGCLAGLECKVVHEYAMPNSTMFVGEVLTAVHHLEGEPLVYSNRAYHRLAA